MTTLWNKIVVVVYNCLLTTSQTCIRSRRDRDRMVVGFTTTYAINAHHRWYCEFESRSGRGVQHYVIKFVSDLDGGSGQNHRPAASRWQNLSHNVEHLVLIEIRTHNISGDEHLLHRVHCHTQGPIMLLTRPWCDVWGLVIVFMSN
jgi:hypothetical protein